MGGIPKFLPLAAVHLANLGTTKFKVICHAVGSVFSVRLDPLQTQLANQRAMSVGWDSPLVRTTLNA